MSKGSNILIQCVGVFLIFLGIRFFVECNERGQILIGVSLALMIGSAGLWLIAHGSQANERLKEGSTCAAPPVQPVPVAPAPFSDGPAAFCPSCGQPHESGQGFCRSCGFRL